MTLQLIDVSVWQGRIDWNAVVNSDISGAIAKASEGVGFTDPQWPNNRPALIAPGSFVGGAYHFARPDLGNSPEAEADWFYSRTGLVSNFIYALDAESAGGSADWVNRFLNHLSVPIGRNCWFYSYASWITSRGINATNRPLWLAWPNASNPPRFGWNSITMRQYGTRSVPGISGQVDANEFYGDLAALQALAGADGANIDLTPDEHSALMTILARADDAYNGVKYGSTFGGGNNQDHTGQPAGKTTLLQYLESINGKLDKVAAPPAAPPVDIKALAHEILTQLANK